MHHEEERSEHRVDGSIVLNTKVEECGMVIREVHVNEWCFEGDK
jgi:hypothetical protein